MTRRVGAFGLVAFLASTAAPAHELGTLRTFVTFHRDGTLVVELIVDREHLPPGFGAAVAGPTPRIEGLTPALEKEIGGILFEASRGARVAFDGRPVTFRISLARSPGETDAAVAVAAELRLLLKGTIPPGARTFTWSNEVPLGTYMLTLESEGQENVERQWLENGKESAPPSRSQLPSCRRRGRRSSGRTSRSATPTSCRRGRTTSCSSSGSSCCRRA